MTINPVAYLLIKISILYIVLHNSQSKSYVRYIQKPETSNFNFKVLIKCECFFKLFFDFQPRFVVTGNQMF